MQRILIIGASVLQLPAIKKAKDMGFTVGVVDFNPDAIGVSFADYFFNVSTIDVDGILEVAKSFKPDGIMTLATDMPMRAIAIATSALGLPGISYDVAVRATDKGEMIKAFESANVESPWFFIVKNLTELDIVRNTLTYPCILKPTDNSGSRGVMMVHEAEQLNAAFAYSLSHSRGGNVIVEEFLTGSEISVEVMAVNGVVHILAITDKLTTGAPYFVEMGHSQPSALPEDDLTKISDLAARAVKAIGIENGPAHVEIMLTKDGPKMIELGARMGGDNITTHLVPLSTGIDMVRATIDLATGKIPDLTPKFQKGSAIRYLSAPEGIISSITGIEQARQVDGVNEVVITKNIGDLVTKVQSSIDRVGYVIAQGKDIVEALGSCKESLSEIRIA